MSQHGPDGRQARWTQHNEARRQRIIDAAITVIEANEPGSEVRVSAIAAEAGVGRTVIYRHFDDRADLDRAVQQQVLDGLWEELLPAVNLEGTVPQIIERVVGTYIHWAVEHPALHAVADHDAGEGTGGPLERGMEEMASQITMLITAALAGLGATPSEDDLSALDPLTFGLIGAVFSAVRRWLGRRDKTISAEQLIDLASQSVWFLIDGHARRLGAVIDPERTVEDMITDVLLSGASAS